MKLNLENCTPIAFTSVNVSFTEGPPPPALKKRRVGKYIYLPVERKEREFGPRAKLAGDLARMGFQVCIGTAGIFGLYRYTDLPPGIFLHKTLTGEDARTFFRIGNAGHLNVSFGEGEHHRYALQLIDLTLDSSLTTADALRQLWRAHEFAMPFSISRAWKTRPSPYIPTPAENVNFPATTDEDLVAIAGHPVEKLDHNCWVLTPR